MQDAPATKTDIQRLEGRIESLDARTHRLASEIVRTHERMDRMEEGLRQEMRQLNSQVLTALDASVGRMETLWRESALVPRTLDAMRISSAASVPGLPRPGLDEHGAMLRDHEPRLGRLESPGRS